MDITEITRLRLRALGLSSIKQDSNPISVVQSLCAMQGQDYPGALWAIAARLSKASQTDIANAFTSGAIVRSWPLRGTLHVCAAEDLSWMLSLTAKRIIASTVQRQKNLELDAAQFELSHDTMRQVLTGGIDLSREEMLAALEAAGLSVANGRGYHFLFRAAVEGLICIGPDRGREQSYALFDEWIPPSRQRQLSREEALAEITFRYFSSHGPASVKDLIGWTGLTAGEIRQGLDSVKNRLESFFFDGIEYWMAPSEVSIPQGQVFLLPGFDEYMLGYKQRDAALNPLWADRICPGSNGMFLATVVVDGQVKGTWKKIIRKGLVKIAVSAFSTFSSAELTALDKAAQFYGDYLGVRSEVTFE